MSWICGPPSGTGENVGEQAPQHSRPPATQKTELSSQCRQIPVQPLGPSPRPAPVPGTRRGGRFLLGTSRQRVAEQLCDPNSRVRLAQSAAERLSV